MNSTDHDIEVFYDGDCPLCDREIRFLRWGDRKQRILFTNIASAEFSAKEYGISLDTLMAQLHGRLPNGQWIQGVEVFRRLYSAVGFGWLMLPTRLPLIRSMLDGLYSLFARNRLKWTGRCNDQTCSLPRSDQHR